MERFIFNGLLRRALICTAVLAALMACKKVVEEDISNAHISQVTPPDNYLTEENLVNFWWEELDGARNYHLLVVKGTAAIPEKLMLDTTISTTKFSYSFNPGKYTWQVRAENAGYQTAYSNRIFTVNATSDLSVKTLVLKSPGDSLFTSASTVKLEWFALDSVEDYRVLVKSPDWSGTPAFPEFTTTESFYEINGLEEKAYVWGVRGENSTSNTDYSTRFIWVDQTNPAIAQLNFPVSNEVIGDSTFSFQWTSDHSSTGTPERDSLFYATDSAFSLNYNRFPVSGGSYTDSLGPGKFYWKIKTYDKAGNSVFSDVESFNIQ